MEIKIKSIESDIKKILKEAGAVSIEIRPCIIVITKIKDSKKRYSIYEAEGRIIEMFPDQAFDFHCRLMGEY